MGSNKWQDLVGLYKSTYLLIKRDQDLLKPMIQIFVLNTISTVLTLSCLYFFFGQKNMGYGFLALLATIGYVPLCSFLEIRQKAALSWMSYEVLTGKDTDMDSGFARLKGLHGKLFIVAMVNVFLNKNQSYQKNKEGGLKEAMASLVFKVLQEVWDVAHNFFIPALTIEKCGMEEGVQKLKDMKKNVPAALAGTIGMDVIGSVTAFVVSFIGLPVFVLGAGAGYFMPQLFPQSWMLVTNDFTVNLLPLFFSVCVTTVFASLISSGMKGLKTIYYSTFYTSLQRPMDIREELRSSVTQYLNFNDKTMGFDFFKNLKPKEDKKLIISKNPEFTQDQVDKLKKAFESNISQGHDPDKIGAFLLKKGFKRELIEFSFQEYVSEGVEKILPFVQSKAQEGHTHDELQKFLKEKGVPDCVLRKALKSA